MKITIPHIITRDKELQGKSAKRHERLGVAAILLSQHLANDGQVVPAGSMSGQDLHGIVFAMVRDNHPTKFHLLCARIAQDLVINPNARVDDDGVYVLPWDPILESFLREALDDPPPEPQQDTDEK